MARLLQVGDVARSRKQWGRLPTSNRDCCPVCPRFVKRGSTTCTCGATFAPIADGVAQVISLDT